METTQQTQDKGTYLYAVVPAGSVANLDEIAGVEQGKVYAIASSDLAAVVSDVPSRGEMRPERKHLSAHQQVLERVTGASPVVLPVSFGTIAESPESVRTLLDSYHQEFANQMRRVEGKIEMRVHLAYAASKPSIFEHLVNGNPDLRAARDRTFGSGAEPSREAKIDLGQKFEALLSQLREECVQKLEQALEGVAEFKRNAPRNERELVNLACLVPKAVQADFDSAVRSAAGLFPDSFAIDQSGPYPPYDFVDVHVKK